MLRIDPFQFGLVGSPAAELADDLPEPFRESSLAHPEVDEGLLLRGAAEWCPGPGEVEDVVDLFARSRLPGAVSFGFSSSIAPPTVTPDVHLELIRFLRRHG
ncbi:MULTISPECIES: hypothetical protein [Rhodococcus]|uniref:hypothetical protein n=1 Tax=Rhodococcus TaxID=1827 RepID=UPI00178C4AB2|nr:MULTISPECIES: hypothetical protein [Rhodococcus]